jgi:chaperone required for assembly of F1-ATPase
VIDPAKMPLTRLANAIIDGVAATPQPVAAEIAKYLASDLLFYRAASPAGLVERQAQHWDTILAWARQALGADFRTGEGIVHIAQPEAALAAARAAIPDDPWRLGAAHVVTTLTGSALVALALACGALSADAAWQAAHVDEDWNMAQWGRDEMALARRDFRHAEFLAAAMVLQSV